MVQNYSSSLHYNLENKNYTETSFAHFGKKNCPRSDTINQFHLHTLATTPTAFHRIQRFNTMITWACHWNPSWTQWMGSTSSYITMIKTEMFQSEARERNQCPHNYRLLTWITPGMSSSHTQVMALQVVINISEDHNNSNFRSVPRRWWWYISLRCW